METKEQALNLERELAALADAHGPSALAHAFAKLSAAVKRRRRHDTTSSVLGQTIREALQLRAKMRTDGASEQELAEGFERTVRSAWPFTREWKYLCQNCDDTGGEIRRCSGTDGSCRRDDPHAAHEFLVPCWCSRGKRFRETPKEQTDATAATKRTRPTRAGY
jgi:hypothetical protein